MSWWSDGEDFDEWEGCDRCSYSKCPSIETCKDCKTGDFYNMVEWHTDEDEDYRKLGVEE